MWLLTVTLKRPNPWGWGRNFVLGALMCLICCMTCPPSSNAYVTCTTVHPKKLQWNSAAHTHTHAHTHARTQPFYSPLGFCPGLPRWAGTRKVKPGRLNESGFAGARDGEWQWHQLGHMQICTLTQTHNQSSIPPLSFYRPDALPAAQPTASKHWRHICSIFVV